MATFSSTNDITKSANASKLFPVISKDKEMSKEQRAAIRDIGKMTSNLASSVPEDTEMTDIETARQESMPWNTVDRKKETKIDSNEDTGLTMKKVRVTLTIRSTKTSEFNPAKLHIDTLHEIHKFDESMIVFDSKGDTKINIESSISETRYKEMFKPVEKKHSNGLVTVSISHFIFLTEKPGSCKEAIFPFIKKNKVFIYFNPKPGLEHFSAIGVLFGPNPDYTWRDELADLLIETMKSDITQEEQEALGTTEDGKPKVLLSLNTQILGVSKPVTTTSVALEVRVPTGKERIYINIIERLYEKAENEEIIVPSKLGKFFPYYMRSKMPEVFTFMMRQQNAEMQSTAIIPIFGYTPAARKQQIRIDGEITTVELALATTKNLIRMEATPSTWNLHKYLVVVKNEHKSSVQKAIQGIFRKITEPLEGQPENFPVPRCGGRETTEPEQTDEKPDNTMTAYMIKLETEALAQNPQDAGPAEPPKRHRRITISYAGAVKAGIVKQKNQESSDAVLQNAIQEKEKSKVSDSVTNFQDPGENVTNDTSINSSLSRSVTNSKINSTSKDIDAEIASLKTNLEQRMDKQDARISELIDIIHEMNQNVEERMKTAILHTLAYEKSKIEEITHGQNYAPSDAPLADENGMLPCGAKAISGGPLDRLHHVEITIQHMADVLDTLVDHLSKDPSARHLFNEDDEKSETPTIIVDQQNDDTTDNDVKMQPCVLGGVKRLYSPNRLPHRDRQVTSDEDENNLTPQKSPPSKRERATNEPSAKPDNVDRERGET
jgi:hypothetical protein